MPASPAIQHEHSLRSFVEDSKHAQDVVDVGTRARRHAGRVAFGCARRSTTIVIHVSDTGRGIASDNLERVFQPFVQVDSTLTRTHEGTGLGLAISRDLARGMGGDLTVESSVGVGSTFTLTLPG